MRRMRSACCACAVSGQVAAEPKMPPMNSRRLIVGPPEAQTRHVTRSIREIGSGLAQQR
jgi:hypothetical protein